MAISFDKALGIHEQALEVRSRRAELLANNLANADTPNYKARDIDFRAALAGYRDSNTIQMEATQPGHIGFTEMGNDFEVLYRTPLQPSLDGNTVDSQQEMARFAKNASDYQASLHFLSSKFRGLKEAIKGGQ